MILVDTSVWVAHLRTGLLRLSEYLRAGEAACHPFVIGELSCGNLIRRNEILQLLSALPSAVVAAHEEVLKLVEDSELSGTGLGWIDVHLLASARLSKCAFWTQDKRLEKAASRIGIPGF